MAESDVIVKKRHPKGLYLLFVTEMAERFSYYGMRGIFLLYLTSALYNMDSADQIYGSYTGLVYLTPLLGGCISDRFWGNRKSIIIGGILMAIGHFFMFFSACFVKKAKYEDDGEIDPNINNTFTKIILFFGLFFLILGNGFFKPNINTMLGDLYDPTDNRKDAAFTIFYMGVNLGAFISPLVCSSVAPKENGYLNPNGYKWGFFCAGIGMVLSVVIFVIFMDKFLVTPDGLQIGLTPDKDVVKSRKNEQDSLVEINKNEKKEEKIELKKNSPFRFIACIIIGIVILFAYMIWLAENQFNNDHEVIKSKWVNFNEWISAFIYGATIALPIFIITDKNLNSIEKSHIGVIYIIAFFVIFFWACYEQAGSSLTYITEHQVDRKIGSWLFPTAWFQSVNPVAIVVLAPVFVALWEYLAKRNIEPSSPTKQVFGLIFLSFGYIVIAISVHGLKDDQLLSLWWIIILYVLHTIGELCLSPIGLSLVNKLSPVHLASLLMGVWFMSNAASNVLAGKLATLLPDPNRPNKFFLGMEIDTLSKFFFVFAILGGISAAILFAFVPFLKKMIKNIE